MSSKAFLSISKAAENEYSLNSLYFKYIVDTVDHIKNYCELLRLHYVVNSVLMTCLLTIHEIKEQKDGKITCLTRSQTITMEYADQYCWNNAAIMNITDTVQKSNLITMMLTLMCGVTFTLIVRS